MSNLRQLFLGSAAMALLACIAATPAQAFGCFKCKPACEPVAVCCPPPPVSVSWCVIDPCTCCEYEVEACVPACCAGVTPCLVDCRDGFLGRKILTYKFECCDHCVDVVITKFGRTIVRD